MTLSFLRSQLDLLKGTPFRKTWNPCSGNKFGSASTLRRTWNELPGSFFQEGVITRSLSGVENGSRSTLYQYS
jgi:hypothetical protein